MNAIVAEFESIFGPLTATERKWLSDHIGDLKSSADVSLSEENDRLITALKPFAEAARQFAPYPESMNDKPSESTFTLGELRAAAAAISTSKCGGTE